MKTMRTLQVKLPEQAVEQLERFMRLEKGLKISTALRYFIYEGLKEFEAKGAQAIGPQARIGAYVRLQDSLHSMIVEDYIPGDLPIVQATKLIEQERKLDSLDQ